MQTIEISIQLDPSVDGINWMPERVKIEGKHAFVIGTNGNYRIIDEDETFAILDRLFGNSQSDYIGKTSFLVVYNANKVIKTGGSRFIAGSVLVIKSGNNGIELLTDDEIEVAKNEFTSRIVTLCGDGIEFSAYELD